MKEINNWLDKLEGALEGFDILDDDKIDEKFEIINKYLLRMRSEYMMELFLWKYV